MGSCSIHGVAWLDDEELKNCLDEKGLFSESKDKEQHILTLIDKWSTCSLNPDQINLTLGETKKKQKEEKDNLISLVKNSNIHRHTDSCRKYGTECRYEFPRFFTEKTIIANQLKDISDEQKKALLEKQQLIFEKVKKGYKKLDKDIDNMYDKSPGRFLVEICELNPMEDPSVLINFDDNSMENVCPFSPDNSEVENEAELAALKTYYNALSFTEKGRKIFLQREISERFVNNYNPLIHSVWQANTDIQVALDTHAVISYITDYMTKSDKGLTGNLAKALKEKKHASNFEQLNHVKQVYFDHKQTCVSEAAYRLLPGLCLKFSSIKTLTLTSGFPQNRKKYAYSKGEDTREGGFQVEGMDGNYEFKEDRFQYYDNRPNDIWNKKFYEEEILSLCTGDEKKEEKKQNKFREKYFQYYTKKIDEMCFAEFNMYYEKVSKNSIPSSTYSFATCLRKNTTQETEMEKKQREKRKKKIPKKRGTKMRKGTKGKKIIEQDNDSTNSSESDTLPPKYKVIAGIGYKTKNVNEDDENVKQLPPYIFIIINNIEVYFKRRNKPFILRTYRGKRKDPIEELYSELLLFTSWRNEKEFFKIDNAHFPEIIQHMCKDPNDSNDGSETPDYLINIVKKGDEIDENRTKIYPFTEKVCELKELLEEAQLMGNSEMESMLDPAGEQLNDEDYMDQDERFNNDGIPDSDYQSKMNIKSSSGKEKCVFKIPIVEDVDTLKSKVRLLSDEQRVVFDLFIDFCQKVKCAVMYKGNIDPVPPKIIVHGGGMYIY